MRSLGYDELRGIWAGLMMTWDEHDRFDEENYRRNVERICASGAHGVYTTGSTGEFYALEFEEFRAMMDLVDDICGAHRTPLQIGCNGDSTRKVLRLLECAAGKKNVGGVQVVVPYWMELNDRELLQYFKDLYACCPDLSLIHYNIPRAKRYLLGPDYVKIREAAPSLRGVKFTFAGSNFAGLQDAVRLNPGLAFFVGENLLASGMLVGARGSCSSLISTNPKFILSLYDHAAEGRWGEAAAMQKIAAELISDIAEFVTSRGEGSMDPVFDKGLAAASGGYFGSQRTRAPYIGWSDETVKAVRMRLAERFPQFISSPSP